MSGGPTWGDWGAIVSLMQAQPGATRAVPSDTAHDHWLAGNGSRTPDNAAVGAARTRQLPAPHRTRPRLARPVRGGALGGGNILPGQRE